MNFEKAGYQTLQYLFAEYKKGPGVLYPINGIAKKYSVAPLDLSDYLLNHTWIRERWVYSGNTIACRITITGIQKIDPLYFKQKVNQIIDSIASAGSSKLLLEILEHNIEEFVIASDFVNQMEQLGLIKISNENGIICVSLTEAGKQYKKRDGTP